jgi:hypothetical protein
VRTRLTRSIVAATAAVMALAFLQTTASAQRGFLEGEPKPPAPIPGGPTPRMPDGKPNLSGVWNSPNFGSLGGPLPLQPWAQKLADDRRKTGELDDPEAKCLPSGVPRISPYPMKIVQTSDLVVMLFEGNVHSYRQFFLGRAHDKNLDPSYFGESIARWDGDTLVVDTVNFNTNTWLNSGGAPHTEQLHVVERYQRPDLGHIEVEITLEDPGALTKPHTFKRSHTLDVDWEIHEYVCNDFVIDTTRSGSPAPK